MFIQPTASQQEIDIANAEFWNTLCGSSLAKMLGITDNQPASLKKFDDWYLDFYPYLFEHVPLNKFSGKQVLEVGLGYGTLSQKIAEAGANYLGMDIALGPVSMVNHRLAQMNLGGKAIQRSFLDNSLFANSFDAVVAIGCFHHTGNIQRCLDEVYRVLKPGGSAHISVYNRYSHRRFVQEKAKFIDELIAEEFGDLELTTAVEHERAASDTDLSGRAAPETIFLSAREFKDRMSAFSYVSITKENMDESLEPGMNRKDVLATWGKKAGLDLYATAIK